ncbi:MAG TPA: YetF domain-containing protein, partial [Jatrophihabitantaceae bacterium]
VNSLVVRVVNRSDLAVRVFEGEDIPLVKDGRFVDRSLRKEGLRRADVEAALRAQNADGALDVAEATLSPGGSIVVWLKPEQMNATRADLAAIGTRLDAIERALGRSSA